MRKGKFIVLEGIDACGKGTQIKRVSAHLFDIDKSMHVLTTREPTKLSKSGENIRKLLARKKDPTKDGALFTREYVEDRWFHIREMVLPAMKAGGIVLSDRYMLSTFTYQLAQGMDLKTLKQMHRGLPKPNLTCIIDITPEEAMKRLSKSGQKKEVFETLAFLTRVRENYLKMKELFPEENIVIIDGMQSADLVFEGIKKEIHKIL